MFFFGAVAEQGPLLDMSTESIFGAHGVGDCEGLPLPSIQVPVGAVVEIITVPHKSL